MRLKQLCASAALCALTASAAHADMKVVQSMTINNPQIKAMLDSMSPEQKANLARMGNPLFAGGPVRTTIYTQGRKMRTDVGSLTFLVDTAARKTIVVNRTAHTYMNQPYGDTAGQGKTTASVKDLKQTRIILGHPAHHYLLTMSSAAMPGGRITADIWAAPDLPQPPSLGVAGGPAALIQSQMRKIKGMPLQATIIIAGSPYGKTTVFTVPKLVSVIPLPANTFTVPAGYKRSAPGSGGMPMIGLPTGGLGG